VDVRQQLRAMFQLDGKFERLEFSAEDPQAAEQLCRTWRDECGEQLEEFRRRYQQIKSLGQRRLASPSTSATAGPTRIPQRVAPLPLPPVGRRVGRNEPCPCGSGLKFKRCCGRGKVHA
jgi:hypothetical protein